MQTDAVHRKGHVLPLRIACCCYYFLLVESYYDQSHREEAHSRRLKGTFDFSFHKADYVALQETALRPWPSNASASTPDNLCQFADSSPARMRAVIVMGADQKYIERVKRCYRGVAPFEMNAQYADLNGYGLRLYIDDDIPFLQRHNKNALMGELRKVFALADAARPGGPHFGVWKTKAQFDEPDFVMWVDSDAHLTPSNLTRNQGYQSILLEDVLRRSCKVAQYPNNYVRILGQDVGGNVNAGWYIVSAGKFGLSVLRYWLELFEIYGPTGVWGQNLIQEALLRVMDGSPPPWSYSLPCSGELMKVLPPAVLQVIELSCGNGAKDEDWRQCVLREAYKHVTSKFEGRLATAASTLNGCFSMNKFNLAPNSQDVWETGMRTIKAQNSGERKCSTSNVAGVPLCCGGWNTFAGAGCYGGRHWSASGAGVVLLNAGDKELQFNLMRLHSKLLWHHGSSSGQFVPKSCA